MRDPRTSRGQNRRRWAATLLVAAGTILGAPSVALGAEETSPVKTVAAFYDWYLARHGQVSKILSQARRFFDDDLYNGLQDSYFKGDEYTGEMLVSFCAANSAPPSSKCKDVRYDPFTNDSLPASSYAIGATHTDGDETTVKVTLRLSRSSRAESHVSARLHRHDGRFVITDLLYEPRGYYYAGPILDLTKFLSAYNC